MGSALIDEGTSALVSSGNEKTLAFIVVSPALGFSCPFGITILVMYFLKNQTSSHVKRIFGRLQICTSIFFSVSHGANYGQKTMGVITALLVAGGYFDSHLFIFPVEVVLASSFAIALGTFFGGW